MIFDESAPVIEYMAPAPVIELSCVSPSQQFPPEIMAADTAGVGLGVVGLINQERSMAAVEVSAPQVDGLRPLPYSRIQKQSVEDVKVLPRVRRVLCEEQSVDLPDPPSVEEIVHVAPITPRECFRQCTVEQVADSPVLRTALWIGYKLLLSTWINVSPSMNVGYRKIVFLNRSRSRFRMPQPKNEQKGRHKK